MSAPPSPTPPGDPLQRLLTSPGAELSRWAAFVSFQARLWRFCAQRLRQNNLMAMAAALSFRTIFALVPALVLAFLAAGALGVLEDSKQSLRQFLDASGFGQIVAVGDGAATQQAAGGDVINVADEILNMVDSVQSKLTFQRIGPVGALLFVWSALSLLTTMEESLNRVFGAQRSRAVARRVLLYWSALTLGPLVLAVTAFVGRTVMDASADLPVMSWVSWGLGWAGPTLVGVLLLTAIYALLPNTRVDPRAALGGAFAAVMLWLLARWGLSVYVERFVLGGNLYGILGVLPLFFMWLNYSWLIFLFGAELAHTASRLDQMHEADADAAVVSPNDALAATLAVARPFEAGAGPVPLRGICGETRLRGSAARWVLRRLVDRGVLLEAESSTDDPRFTLARPAARIAVRDILEAGLARPAAQATAPVQARIDAALADLSLADLLLTTPGGPAAPAAREAP